MKKEDWSQLPAPDHIHKFEFETGIEITDDIMLEYRIAKCFPVTIYWLFVHVFAPIVVFGVSHNHVINYSEPLSPSQFSTCLHRS